MADGYVSQVQLPNNETYDIKDKNAVKDITSSDIPGNVSFTKGEETKDILVKDFGTAYGIDCYKGKFPLDFTSPGGAIDEWKIYGNSSGPTEVIETQSTLPVSIDTYGGNAVDWEIYGNNNPVIETESNTLPIDISSSGGNAIDWVIEGNDDVGKNLINVADFTVGAAETHNVFSGILPAGTYTAAVYQNTALTSAERNTLVILKKSGAIYESANTNYHLAADWHYLTFTIAESENVNLRYWTVNASSSVNCTSVMLVEGSTAPDHYIPYQQGVGERTENVIPSAVNGTYTSGRGTVTCNNGNYHFHVSEGEGSVSIFVPVPEFTLPVSVEKGGNGRICFFNSKAISTVTVVCRYNNTQVIGAHSMTPVNRVATNYGTSSTAQCNTLQFYATSSTTELDIDIAPCIVTGDMPTSFIPYGYQVPLTVSQTGQTDKNYDIYIGDSPLTEGETVSKSSTGVDIELFNGNNIIDTSLFNKPNTSITYNSSVLGVGERTENLFDGTYYNGYINDSGQYVDGANTRTAFIKVEANTQYSIRTFDASNRFYVALYDHLPDFNDTGILLIYSTAITEHTYTLTTNADTAYVGVYVSNQNDEPRMVCIKGSTPSTSYIPGYKIPLIVTSGQQSTPHTIYIGSTPLTEGQSVTKASSGTDIALYQGENTISTTLGNKPEMRIDYLSTVVGVGERTENLFDFATYKSKLQINPVPAIRGTVSFGDNNVTITASGDDTYTQSYNPINQYVYTVTVEPNTQYTLSWKTDNATKSGKVFIFWYEGESTTYTSGTSIQQGIGSLTITTTSTTNKLSFRFGVQSAGESLTYSDIMLIKGSTAPETYKPYGYQIPIDIKQDDEVVDHKDIYIGTQPLIEGDYINQIGVYRRLHQFVNYASSSSLPNYNFIPITEQLIAGNGENTITTSLVNNTTIDVELHPTKQASWICDRLEDLQRRIDNVDSTLGAPERRNYLVTWCSEDRLTGSTANLDFSFNNKDSGYSTFLIDGKSTATSAFVETIDLLHMINGTTQPDNNNYTIARPGKYVVVIFGVEMENSSSNIITLKIIRDNVVIASQQLINEYIGCIPFEIPNDIFGNNTIIQIEVNSTTGWTDLSFGAGIAVLNATMLLQDSNLKTDTMAIGNFSMYDSYVQLLRSHRSLESKCTILENKCTVLENEYDQLANESVKDITVYSDYTSTIPSGLNIDISQYKNKIKYVDIYFTDNNYRKGEVYPYNILAENFGYLRIPYGQIYTGASADEATRLSLSLIGDENSYYIRRELFYVSTDYEQEHLFFSQYSSVPGLILQFVGTPTNEWSDFSVKGKVSEVIKIYEVHLIVSP